MAVPFGVISSLEAWSLETHPCLCYFWSIGHGQWRKVLAAPLCGKLNRCCRPLTMAFATLVAVGSCRIFVGSGCLQQTAGAGVAWQPSIRCGTMSRTALVAPTSWDNLACNRPQRAAQLSWAFRCGTSSEDGTSEFFGWLARQQRLCAWMNQGDEADLQATARH